MIAEEVVSGGKVRFASSMTWGTLVKSRVSADTWVSVDTTLTQALQAEVHQGSVISGNDSGNDSGKETDSARVVTAISEPELIQDQGDQGDQGDEEDQGDNEEMVLSDGLELFEEIVQGDFDENCGNSDGDIHIDSDDVKIGSDYSQLDDEIFLNVKDSHSKAYFEDRRDKAESPNNQEDKDVGPVESSENSGDSSENSDASSDSDSDSDSSSSSDSGAEFATVLPLGVAAWVMDEVDIPSQFSVKEYSKAFALKSYDMEHSLKKDLKKLAKWWMKPNNSERSSKVIQQVTADKREERVLCYLGFVQTYKCLPEGYVLCLGLCLNHKLFEAYLEYLQKVRQSAPGTIAEAITAAVYICKWLYRKNPSGSSQILRRYKDWRNSQQNQAIRVRKQEDKDDLLDKNKWIGKNLTIAVLLSFNQSEIS